MDMSVVAVRRLDEAHAQEERRRLMELSIAIRAAQSDTDGWREWCNAMDG